MQYKETSEEKKYLRIIHELEDALKEGFLRNDPNNANNILVYCAPGTNYPEGWYSKNIFTVASELFEDEENYQQFLSEIEGARKRKRVKGLKQK